MSLLKKNFLRYSFRSMRRNTGFAVFAILIAGLGVGASATVFSVVNTLLLRPLPFERPSELVWIANRDLPDLSGQTTQVGYLPCLRGAAGNPPYPRRGGRWRRSFPTGPLARSVSTM
jgi:hypothetical protein